MEMGFPSKKTAKHLALHFGISSFAVRSSQITKSKVMAKRESQKRFFKEKNLLQMNLPSFNRFTFLPTYFITFQGSVDLCNFTHSYLLKAVISIFSKSITFFVI